MMRRVERAALALTMALLLATAVGLGATWGNAEEVRAEVRSARSACERDVAQLRGAWLAVAREVTLLKRGAGP